MATKTIAPEAPAAPSAPTPTMEVEGEAVWTADDGMVISTIHVTQTLDAYVAVEHPEGMTAAQVLRAAKDRALDFAPSICWWDATKRTEWAEIALGANTPSEPSAKPFPLVVTE